MPERVLFYKKKNTFTDMGNAYFVKITGEIPAISVPVYKVMKMKLVKIWPIFQIQISLISPKDSTVFTNTVYIIASKSAIPILIMRRKLSYELNIVSVHSL